MRYISLRLLALPGAFLLLSGFSEVHPGPPVVPYQCGDGHPASVVYESGSDFAHARALVTYNGRTVEMHAAPTLYGARYRSVAPEGATPLAWTLHGEDGWLTEAPTDRSYAGTEREIARCARVRDGAAPAPTASPAEAH